MQQLQRFNIESHDLHLKKQPTEKWEPIPNWIKFFLEIGKFATRNDSVNIYISYIDDIIPASFISLGAVIGKYVEYQDIEIDSEWINSNLSVGDSVYYRKSIDSNTWQLGKVVNIYNNKHVNEKFNPYVVIETQIPKEEPLFDNIPLTLLLDKVRLGGNVKKTSGNIVKLNDCLKPKFDYFFNDDIKKHIKFRSENIVNIIGSRKENDFREFSRRCQLRLFSLKTVVKIDDWLYYGDEQYNLNNLSFIKSPTTRKDNKSLNIFMDSTAVLNFSEINSKRNVFIVNRMKVYDYNMDNIERVSQNIIKNNLFNNTNLTDDLIKLLSKKNIEIPKGVELYAYR